MIPDITSLIVVVLVLLCVFLVNTLIFQPIMRVIDARLAAVSEARDLAESASSRAAAASAEYDRTLNAARSEVYREMDEKRRVALDRRTALLADTRTAVERELGDAATTLENQKADARSSLDREAETLAGAIVTRVLGRAS